LRAKAPLVSANATAGTSDIDHFGSRHIVGMRVDASSYENASERILTWAQRKESRYVCVASVNNVMEAHDDAGFKAIMNGADFVTSDGMPLVWGLRALGIPQATRVYGPDLTPALCAKASEQGISVGFYGGAPDVLQDLVAELRRRWPGLQIAYQWSPPWRPLTSDEDEQVIEDVNGSGAQILFVGLSTPKQERFMVAHRGQVQSVMVGVGAAFDFLAGRKKQAPEIMQKTGTEWLFRLVTEPRRLWRRYLYHNPRFAALFALELASHRFSRPRLDRR